MPASTRPAQIVALKQANPTMLAVDIAKAVGVSRERVRQVLTKAGLPTHHPLWRCERCGLGTSDRNHSRRRGLCTQCAEAQRKTAMTVMDCCDRCGVRMTWRLPSQIHKAGNGTKRYCSTACRDEANVERWRAMGLANKGKHRLDLRKAVCKRGHPRTPENVYADGECIQCKREHNRANYLKRTGRLPAQVGA